MNEHVDFVQYYDPKIKVLEPADPAKTMADDIEEKWEQLQRHQSCILLCSSPIDFHDVRLCNAESEKNYLIGHRKHGSILTEEYKNCG
jgi:hypothetical protein